MMHGKGSVGGDMPLVRVVKAVVGAAHDVGVQLSHLGTAAAQELQLADFHHHFVAGFPALYPDREGAQLIQAGGVIERGYHLRMADGTIPGDIEPADTAAVPAVHLIGHGGAPDIELQGLFQQFLAIHHRRHQGAGDCIELVGKSGTGSGDELLVLCQGDFSGRGGRGSGGDIPGRQLELVPGHLMALGGPHLVGGEHGTDIQPIFLAGSGLGTLQRDAYHRTGLRIHIQLEVSGGHHFVVGRNGPGGLVIGSVEEVAAVPDFHRAQFRVQQFELQGLGALFHLPHLRLGNAVRPDGSVRAGAGAVGIEGTLLRLFLEIQPQAGLGRIELAGLYSIGKHAHIVDKGIADVHIDFLAVGLFAAADAQGQRQVADGAAHGLGSRFRAIDIYLHGRTVIRGGHVVPLVLPICGERGGKGLFAAVVQIEVQFVGPLLFKPVLIFALGDEIAAALVEFAGEDVQGKGEFVSRDFHGIGPVHLDPLVLLVQVDGLARRPRHQPGPAHDVRGDGVRGLVLEGTYRLRDAYAYEIPDGAAEELRMRINHIPVVVHAAATVAGHREVFVHEGRTQVFPVQAVAHLMLQRRRIAGAHDVLCGMLGRIAAVHPETGGIQALALLHNLGDVVALAALVAGAPEQDAGVVAVAQHHPAHTFLVHLSEFRHFAHIFGGVGLVTRFVNDEQAVLVGQLQILVHGRIVGRAYTVEIEALQDFHIFADGGLVHGVAQFRVLHVGALGAHFDGRSVEIEHSLADFGLLEADALGDGVHHFSVGIHQLHVQVVEHGRVGGPFFRSAYPGAHLEGLEGTRRKAEGGTLHLGYALAVLGHAGAHLIALLVNIIALHIHGEGQVRVLVIRAEVRDYLPVEQAGLGRRIEHHVVEDTGQAPVILAFQVVTVGVLEHQHGQGVLAGFQVRGNVVFGRLLGTLVIAHFLSVHPDKGSGSHFLEAEEHFLSLPGLGHRKRGPVCAGRIHVPRDAGNLHGEGIPARGAAQPVLGHPFLHLGSVGIGQDLLEPFQARLRHLVGERSGYITEQRLTEPLHLPVGGNLDQGPLFVVEARLEEGFGHIQRGFEVLELPFPVQGKMLLRDMVGPAGLLVLLKDRQVLHIIRQVFHVRLVLGKSLGGQKHAGKEKASFAHGQYDCLLFIPGEKANAGFHVTEQQTGVYALVHNDFPSRTGEIVQAFAGDIGSGRGLVEAAGRTGLEGGGQGAHQAQRAVPQHISVGHAGEAAQFPAQVGPDLSQRGNLVVDLRHAVHRLAVHVAGDLPDSKVAPVEHGPGRGHIQPQVILHQIVAPQMLRRERMAEGILLTADPHQDHVPGNGRVHEPGTGDIGERAAEQKVQRTLGRGLAGLFDDEPGAFRFYRGSLILHGPGSTRFHGDGTGLPHQFQDLGSPAGRDFRIVAGRRFSGSLSPGLGTGAHMGPHDAPHVGTGAQELVDQMEQTVSVAAEIVVDEHFHTAALRHGRTGTILGRLGHKDDARGSGKQHKKRFFHISSLSGYTACSIAGR